MKTYDVMYGSSIITVHGKNSLEACQIYGLLPIFIKEIKEIN